TSAACCRALAVHAAEDRFAISFFLVLLMSLQASELADNFYIVGGYFNCCSGTTDRRVVRIAAFHFDEHFHVVVLDYVRKKVHAVYAEFCADYCIRVVIVSFRLLDRSCVRPNAQHSRIGVCLGNNSIQHVFLCLMSSGGAFYELPLTLREGFVVSRIALGGFFFSFGPLLVAICNSRDTRRDIVGSLVDGGDTGGKGFAARFVGGAVQCFLERGHAL